MTKSRLTWKDIKSELKELTPDDFLGVLADLYDLDEDNRRFLHARYARSDESLKSYKDIIRKAVCPTLDKGQDLKLSAGRKAISDYRKAVGHPKDMLELMVYYVECGNEFTLTYGDIDEPFYNSLVSMFNDIVSRLMKAQDEYLLHLFLPRLQNVVRKANDIGWGYYDAIADLLADLEKSFEKAA
jgi:hypothetical protein